MYMYMHVIYMYFFQKILYNYVLITLWCKHVQYMNWHQKYTVKSKYAYKMLTLTVKLASFPSIFS